MQTVQAFAVRPASLDFPYAKNLQKTQAASKYPPHFMLEREVFSRSKMVFRRLLDNETQKNGKIPLKKISG